MFTFIIKPGFAIMLVFESQILHMKNLMIWTALMLLTACSEAPKDNNNQPENNPKANRFEVAAQEKIKAANAGMTNAQAACVVGKLTGDGTFGVGEINQMKTTEQGLSGNSRLTTAYQQALKDCQ